MRGSSELAPDYSLLLKNLPSVIKKFLTHPEIGNKKNVLVIAFRIALTLDVKIVSFGCC